MSNAKSPDSAACLAAWERERQKVYQSSKAMVPRHDAYEVGYVFGYRAGYEAAQADQQQRIAEMETALHRIVELRDVGASDMYDAHYRKGVRDARYHAASIADAALSSQAAPSEGGS